MSTDRDTTRIVRSWLRIDEHESADRVLDAVLDQLDTTPQRRASWLARRFPIMNSSTFRLGIAAVAMVALALLGWKYLPVSGVGGPPEATPSPTATPLPTPFPTLAGQNMAAGTYRGVLPGEAQGEFMITVPEGWDALGLNGVGAPDNDPPRRAHGILFWDVQNLYIDPLRPQEGLLDPPVGPSVDDLVNALVDHDGWTTTTPVDVTIGGYPGQMLELTVPSDADFVGCDAQGNSARPFAIWSGGGDSWRCMQGPGQTDYVYVVDVAGERVVVTLIGYPNWNGTYLERLQAMVNSLEFVPG
jgi:hypothetical protein